jgi:photosystem II stability/assembly factor-like uncharacterized protein
LASTNGAKSFFPTAATFADESKGELSATPGMVGDLWLAAHQDGLYHSTNGGASFTRLESVRQADSLGFGKSAAGQNFPALYLAGQIGDSHGLFRSDDVGVTWTRINDDQHQYGAISQVTGDPRVFGRVYFATSGRGIIYGEPVSQ